MSGTIAVVLGVFESLRPWTEKAPQETLPELVALRDDVREQHKAVTNAGNPAASKDAFLKFKTAFTRTMIERAARRYVERHGEVVKGALPGLFLERAGKMDDEHDLLERLKGIARTHLYPADEVEKPFLAGLQVIRGTLDAYRPLLSLDVRKFGVLWNARQNGTRDEVRRERLDTLLPLFDRLALNQLDVYRHQVANPPQRDGKPSWRQHHWEWFCRAHLIVDFISGMADDFACSTYSLLAGNVR